MLARGRKGDLYEHLARVGKAVSAPRRLELIDLLGQAPRTVEALATQARMSVANTSQHLQVLRAAGLVDCERDGLHVVYRLTSPAVLEFYLGLRSVAEQHVAEVERVREAFFAGGEDLEPLTGDELLERVRKGQVVLLDVRPSVEFEAAHIPGARSAPIDALKRELGTLPKSRRIVAYCRGPYCVYALEAVRMLRARGFDARRMEEGVPEWRARGLPVEASS
jgi:rhodanese-related sulfurtransferase/DNA-binding transcriptional ArsR family regulator